MGRKIVRDGVLSGRNISEGGNVLHSGLHRRNSSLLSRDVVVAIQSYPGTLYVAYLRTRTSLFCLLSSHV